MPGRCLPHSFALILILTSICTPLPAATQGTLADYARAMILHNPGPAPPCKPHFPFCHVYFTSKP